MLKHIFRHRRTQSWGARALGAYLEFALRTTRWTVEGAEHLAPYLLGRPGVFAFWHDRLPLLPAMWALARRQRAEAGRAAGRMHVLVSRHQDGRFIGAMMRSVGCELVHGSSAKRGEQKGGAAGVRALVAVLGAGDQVAITPDGPRGPSRRAASGVAQVAALAAVPVVPLSAQSSRRRELSTWDHMVLPLPFGRGTLVCGVPIEVPRENWSDSLPAIEAALSAASDRADALCGK